MELAPNVYLARVNNQAIALDLRRDRYTALGAEMADAASKLLSTLPPTSKHDARLASARAALLAKGILSEKPTRTQRRQAVLACETVWPSLEEDDDNSWISPMTLVTVMWALAGVWLALHLLPFRLTIAWIESQRSTARSAPARSEQSVLSEYFAARPWFPVKPICRLDALALTLHLRRNGLPTDLVFGVRLEPFRAHCWVQRGSRVLNEPHEVVARYTPIMVV